MLMYLFEPSLLSAPYSDERHWRFVFESIADLNQQLSAYHQQLISLYGEAIPVFKNILEKYEVKNVFSYQETGTWLTFQRDIQIKQFFKERSVRWLEYQQNAVVRGLKNRKTWTQDREGFLAQKLEDPKLVEIIPFDPDSDLLHRFSANALKSAFNFLHPMQQGGEKEASKILSGFLNERYKAYTKHISRPEESRIHCSRLSPYLAWGNVSVRQVIQECKRLFSQSTHKSNLLAFESRLAWHCHFIQKLETEPSYEFKNLNSAYDLIRTRHNDTYLTAWKEGLTGYPLVDACMRCVKQTGYLNFRMRAMLVSFLTHHLWLDWRQGANFLARQFLDFDPGIHFPQFQMQAGTTGINTLRIYNPVKQALEHDNEAVFIKKWVVELKNLPPYLTLQPWKIHPLEAPMYQFRYGIDYPERIVDLEETYKYANQTLWSVKKSIASKKEAEIILKKHVNTD